MNRLRAVAAAIAVLAILVYVNTSQLEDESENALYTAGALNTVVTRVLAERHAAAVTNAWVEYGSLLAVATCVGVVVAAPRLTKLRVRA